MKVLAICGSPRKGNTEWMLRKALEGAKEAGADTELVLLRNLKIGHCCGCLWCDVHNKCHKKDDMQKLYPKLVHADSIVLGSPCYYENVSGLMKDFIDRTAPFFWIKKLKGKKVLLAASGEMNPKYAINAMKMLCNDNEMKILGSVVSLGKEPQSAAKNKSLSKKCKELGRKLARK